MQVLKHELRRGRRSLLIWALAIGGMLAIVVLIYPQMKASLQGFGGLVATMGVFAKAFGLDKLDFTQLLGYYALETGNVLGIGGAMFAGLTGILSVSREEDGHLAEFLFSHPIRRGRVLWQKLLAVLCQILALQLICLAIAALAIWLIGQGDQLPALLPLHLALALMSLQIGLLSFGLSCLSHRNNFGLGIGLSLMLYFLQLISAIATGAQWLRWLTPFAYADAASVLSKGIAWPLVAAGWAVSATVAAVGLLHYRGKDLAA